MDSLHFDPYASTPRTPSPHDVPFSADFKQPLGIEPRIYEAYDDDPALYAPPLYCPRGSLLQELYDHDLAQQPQQYPHPIARRATFPYVRHDRDYGLFYEPISEAQEFLPMSDDPPIKLEDSSSLVVPSQSSFYPRPPAVSYLPTHPGLPVQHTDDAASKETQYLRRRCFNCHTTEPPSWRRSTLNPGKIVCNKCGLYERTHLRPRPLRFDELRAGNKARTNKNKGTVSPKSIKKEPREFGLVRRSSVSSSSGSGTSDWDDNVSVYSSGSAPPTSFNSPSTNTFSLDRDSQSPPRDGAIRLPNAPLSDLALAPASISPSPRKAHTLPYYSSPAPAVDYFHCGPISESAPQSPPHDWQPVLTASPPNSILDLSVPSEDLSS